MKVVYVIGALRADTPRAVELNIREAEDAALQVWRAGLSAICVHSSTRFMHGAAPESTFLEGTLAQLRISDAVIVVGGWEHSIGSRLEVAEALKLGLPILYAWGDTGYSEEILRALGRTPDGYRCPGLDPHAGLYWLGGYGGAWLEGM
jgi:hypothetical protein